MSIQANIERLARLEAIANNHLVGGVLDFEVPGKLRYIFFERWSGLDGVQVSLADGKAAAYKLLIERLDRFYNEENAWMSFHNDINSLEGYTELAL